MIIKYGLEGVSQKQIDYAFECRLKAIKKMDSVTSHIRSMDSTEEGKAEFAGLASRIEGNWKRFMEHYTDSVVWIEQSDYLMQQCIEGTIERSKGAYIAKYAEDIKDTCKIFCKY